MGSTGVMDTAFAARFGPAVLAAVSALFCAVVNPAADATDWSNIASIATGISFGLALAVAEALWGRGRWLAVLIPVATLIGWIAAWWSTILFGQYIGELVGSFFGEGTKDVVGQISGGVAGGAVGALLSAPSVAVLRQWGRLAIVTALGAVLGASFAVELQYGLPVLYMVWQVGIALYAGHCMAGDRARRDAGRTGAAEAGVPDSA